MYGNVRNLFIGLCLFLCGTALFGRDSVPAFYPAGVFPASGSVSELKVLHDGLGNVYALYVEDGRFRALKADGRGSLEPYQVEGLDPDIYDARQLELSVFGTGQYAAFIGSLNGSEGVFVLGLDFAGTLRYYPVPEMRGLGKVSGYFIAASSSKGAAVFVLSGGKLNCIAGIGGSGGLPVYVPVTGGGERIEGAGSLDVMADFHYPLGRGWFTLEREGKREAVIFSLDGDFLVHRKSIGSYTGEIGPRNGMNIEGDSIVTFIREKHVEVYESDGAEFLRKQSFDAPEMALRYDAVLESFGLLTAGTAGAEALYGVKDAGINAPLFEMWFKPAGGNETALFYEGADSFCLAGKRADGWYVTRLDSRGTVTGGERLEGIGAGEKLFAYGARDGFRLYFFDPDRLVITVCEKRDTRWHALDPVELPAEIPAAGADWNGVAANHPLFLEDRLIPVNAKGGTLLFETGTGRISLLENSALHASRNINGIIYCAALNNGEIALSRIEEAE
ncbi:MAG: hypothetical protein LBB83_06375 [Treponema sp.]|jgi:hypothetical protein|nr:hypothetical protein [Treponema sp.]